MNLNELFEILRKDNLKEVINNLDSVKLDFDGGLATFKSVEELENALIDCESDFEEDIINDYEVLDNVLYVYTYYTKNTKKRDLIKVLEKLDRILIYHNKNLKKLQYNELDEARNLLIKVLKQMED